MKKIIIAYFILLQILGLNAFAKSYKQNFTSQQYSALRNIINEDKQNLQKINSFKSAIKDLLLYDNFETNSTEETFKILLPKSLEKNFFIKEKISWEKENIKFIVYMDLPYLHIKIYQSKNNYPIKMSLRKIYNQAEQKVSLILDYKITGKEFKKILGKITPQSKIIAPSFKKVKLGKTFAVREKKDAILNLADIRYKTNIEFFEHEYFAGRISAEYGKIYLNFENDNPLVKSVSVRLIKEGSKVYCISTIGKNTYKDLIVIKK